MLLENLVFYIIGVAVGAIITNIIQKIQTAKGALKIDCSDPDKDRYRLEIDNLDALSKKKRVVLKVDANADLSPK